MPDATITSTASTFGTISGTFAADQSTIVGTVTGIVAGTLDGSVGVPGPAGSPGATGATGATGPAGPAGAPGVGVPAGGASGQFLQKTSGVDYATDWVTVNLTGLATESWVTAGFYPLTGNPSSFLTASALTPYLTSATAASTYQTLAGMSSYLTTSAAAAGYYPLSGNPSGFLTAASLSGYATESWVTGQGYITSAALTPYLTSATAASTYQTLTGMSDYLAKAGNLAGLSSTSTARTNLGLGSLAVVNDAPSDGSQYARRNAAWEVVSSTSPYITSVSSPLSVTTGNLTIDLSTYAPLASPVFTGDARAVTPAFGDNDTSIATTAFVQAALAGGTAVARNLEVEVRNQSGSTIAAGSIVYISGATGNKPLITLAQANNDANSAQTIGFVKTAIANNGTGYVIVRGELENIDTSALTEGVQLYLSPTIAGTWTTTKPSAPQHLVYVGIVIRSHPTLGTILVAVQNGYELGEIHDVALSGLANNDLLAYESSTDLWKNKTYSALGLLTSATAASTYQTLSGMSDYLTTATASTTYYPLTNPDNYLTSYNASFLFYPLSSNPAGYLTSAPVTSVAGRTGAITLANTDISGLGTMATATASDYSTTTAANGLYYPLSSNPASYLVAADIAGLAPLASPSLTGNVTITSNTSGAALFIEQAGTGNILTLHDQASDTNFVAIDQNGKVSTIPAVTTGAGFNIAHGTTPTSGFVNGDIWTTTSGLFARINAGTRQFATLSDGQSFSGNNTFTGPTLTFGNTTAASTIGIGTGATVSGSTRTISIGTGSAAGSTNAINIGGGSGTITTTLNGTTNFNGPITGAINNITLGNGTAASTFNLFTGATVSGSTKAVAIASGGAAGSTTTVTIGNTTGSTTTLQGITNGVTAAADTNSVALATTAFVVGQAGSATPLVNGTAAVGTSLRYARQDHVHPTDTSRAPLASPALTGTPTAPTATLGTNTTQIATTAFVLANAPAAPVTSVAGRTGAVVLANTDISGLGTMSTATAADYSTTTAANGLYYPLSSNPAGYLTSAPVTSVAGRTGAITLAVADVSGAAPLASPALTGTPTAPTATGGTNTTQIATTAFVTAAIPTNNVKAWVNFNGTGTVAIRASMNVSSITDNGTGDYTMNFTSAITDANYAAAGFAGDAIFSVGVTLSSWGTYTQTTSAFRFKVYYGTNTVVDTTNIHMAIHR
jgi:hypothetical protein